MTSGGVRRAAAAVLAVSVLVAGCSRGGDGDGSSDASAATTAPPTTVTSDPDVFVEGASGDDETGDLALQLSEGDPSESTADDPPVVEGDPLADADVDEVVDRLPDWNVPDDDQSDFERPAEALPPPTAATTVEMPFPPPNEADGPPTSTGGPLQVVGFQPEGPVDLAPFVTVTFDQPMAPLTTIDQLGAADVPVQMSPDVDGRWRWIGTRTLRFEVEPDVADRLPAATEYRLVVPAGTTSLTGGELADDVAWEFATPPPIVTEFVGDEETTALAPVFVAVFDQIVDPDAVLAVTSVETFDGPVAIRLATPDEVDADAAARQAVDAALDGRAFAFRPLLDLPADASFTVTIGPDTPSAEGPLTSPNAEIFTGRTFGSLRVDTSRCGYGDGCLPGTPFVFEFNNVLDPDAFDSDLIQIDPAVPDLSINVYGNVIELLGATVGRTTYTVQLDADLTDVFGQTLGDDVAVAFDVEAAPPTLLGLPQDWIVTDPTAEVPQVSVSTINHDSIRVRAWAVTPNELGEFREYQEAMWSDADTPDPEWTAVFDDVVEIEAEPDTWIETTIDLGSAFAQAGTQLVLRVDPTIEFDRNDDDYWRNQPTLAWVQSTTVGIDAILDRQHLVIWTTDLVTGDPIGGVPVELIGDGRLATTDDEGLAEIELGDAGVTALWANAGERTALLPASNWRDGWQGVEPADEARWYVFDDRGVYRPGETVRLTGWVRNLVAADGFQLRLLGDDLNVDYVVRDALGNELAGGDTAVNALGGFNASIEIPASANLGTAWVDLEIVAEELPPNRTTHSFAIQEFRRPAFEVATTPEGSPPFTLADAVTMRADATYFSGGPLPAAPVEWLVTKQQTSYQPPNWGDFTFGIWTPWWIIDDGFARAADVAGDLAVDECFDCGPPFDVEVERFSGLTDASGTHRLLIEFDGDDVDLPTAVTAEATVVDVNRQAIADRSQLLIHAADLYVGLRADRPFVVQGTPIRVEGVVTDVDGGTIPDREVDVTAGRLEWVRADGEWVEQVVDIQDCTFTSSGDVTDGSMTCEFDTEVGGTYQITATVSDDEGGINRTELTQWVSGGAGRPTRSLQQDQATIVPDREAYEPGDVAEVLIQAPFAPAHGIVTIARGEIISTEAFEAEDGSAVIEIPIDEAWIPGVDIQVDLAGSAPRVDDNGDLVDDAPPRPAYATGRLALSIPPTTRALDVVAAPADEELQPGADTSVTVTVTDAAGEPVSGADVAVVIADEAVLALTGYELADPLDVFYAPIFTPLQAEYMRSRVLLARADLVNAEGDDLAERASADGGAGAGVDESTEESGDFAADDSSGGDANGGSDAPPIDIRTDFDPVAVYEPSLSTGADGTITVDVPLPDTLTRYRVMAVAVDGDDRFGKGESTITARLPLQVQPSTPRFLNFGDQAELPVVVQNQTSEPIDVDVVLEVSNLILTGPAGQRVSVPPNDRVELRFPVSTDAAGVARYRVAAVSSEHADAATGSFPVYTPATAEAFATYGVVDDGSIAQPVIAPTGVWPQFGGLEINTSSTALQALTDAVIYLADYEYESADGLAARIMAISTLRDVLGAFNADGLPDPDELDAAVQSDIRALTALQNDDGGFPTWQRGRMSVPWVSIQATHALVLAEQAGYTVSADSIRRGLDFLATIEQSVPDAYTEQTRDTVSAYALYVRNVAGEPDTAKATDLYRQRVEELELDAIAWLWPSIDDAEIRDDIDRRIRNGAVETAGAVTFATSYDEGAYVIAQSDTRSDAVVLDALIAEQPGSDLIPKAVAGLLAGQDQGRWNNVHENAFVSIALQNYFDTFESTTPDFLAQSWLGDLYVAETEFRGRSTDQVSTLVPMPQVVGAGDVPVTVAKDGDGRLYYRIGLRYAPTDLVLDPRDEGFVVERSYEGVDDPDDVRRNDDGSWTIRAGATVRVNLTMVADARRTNMALVDPLPAGLEPLNPAFELTPTITAEEGVDVVGDSLSRPAWLNWFEHQNLRDDRAEAFASVLPGGIYEYSYVARATTPGSFVVPPARAEEVFAPEVFGRSATGLVTIES